MCLVNPEVRAVLFTDLPLANISLNNFRKLKIFFRKATCFWEWSPNDCPPRQRLFFEAFFRLHRENDLYEDRFKVYSHLKKRQCGTTLSALTTSQLLKLKLFYYPRIRCFSSYYRVTKMWCTVVNLIATVDRLLCIDHRLHIIDSGSLHTYLYLNALKI